MLQPCEGYSKVFWHAWHLVFGLKLMLCIAQELEGLVCPEAVAVPERAVALQAAPYVAALAACYAEARQPPVQVFNAILQVSSTVEKRRANTATQSALRYPLQKLKPTKTALQSAMLCGQCLNGQAGDGYWTSEA